MTTWLLLASAGFVLAFLTAKKVSDAMEVVLLVYVLCAGIAVAFSVYSDVRDFNRSSDGVSSASPKH